MRKLIAVLVIVGLAASAIFVFTRRGDAETSSYRYVDVEQGDLEAVVAATGALTAVTTVQVGTQVSGQITDILVDFNDNVKRGQLVARIDPTLLTQAVLNAEANLSRNQAELARREWEFQRSAELFKSQGVTESEYKTAEYDLAVSRSNLASAEVNLEQARRNLGYSEIYAPIDGVVVERNVEPGQTVASSMSTPQLFLIANDLKELEILASVDESDIGQIHEGQPARFTVQAYPDDSFAGTVRQVRLQSSVQENVVAYTVVVSVRNEELKLLPGMTATVDFIVERVENVLKVPNAALRFRPNQAMLAEIQERRQAMREQGGASPGATGDSAGASEGRPGRGGEGGGFADLSEEERAALRERFQQGGGAGGTGGAGGFGGGGGSQLYYVDADGLLQVARVQVGVTDGQYTEVTGRSLEVGMQVIAGVVVSSAGQAPANPFQQQQENRGFGRGF
jgi:HlyD family secretion protein